MDEDPAITDALLPPPIPQISFDFVTSDVGNSWRESSPDPPGVNSPGTLVGVPDEPEIEASAAPPAETELDPPAEPEGESEDGPETNIFESSGDSTEPVGDVASDVAGDGPRSRVEVALADMAQQTRDEYEQVFSHTVEFVLEAVSNRSQACYNIEFTDGRQELVYPEKLLALENGPEALVSFENMASTGQKRKHAPDEDWHSDGDDAHSDDLMDLDEDDQDLISRLPRTQGSRALRTREVASRQGSRVRFVSSDDEQSNDDLMTPSSLPTRSLRKRTSPKQQLESADVRMLDADRDELANMPSAPTDDDDDEFRPVVSDIAVKKPKRSGVARPLRRLQAQRARSKARLSSSRHKGDDDSDIEFEAPRRSSRATKNNTYMEVDVMDDDSLYVVDDKTYIPKAVSVREIFQPISPESPFGSIHLSSCHTCGGSRQRGQLVHCQGCSLSYHRLCLGNRTSRDHLVTKIGDDDFVLQCRFCIDIYQQRGKKDKSAKPPRQSLCQGCKRPGKACAPFSEKKTTRQEEKLREENDGKDPITRVPDSLINNNEIVLCRCISCHRGWHSDHLPSNAQASIGTDLKSERIKDFKVDWQCDDCSSKRHKIHRLVAWRPAQPTSHSSNPSFDSVDEDDKEYLVKWETQSYFHCVWKPGAWIFGVATSAMFITFAKRALQDDLLKLTEKDAIPEEYLMADVIFSVKMKSGLPKSRSKEADQASIDDVSKVMVKFQGLGYDDVVWDSPPPKDMTACRGAYVDAYLEHIEGRYFAHESQSKIQDRVKAFKAAEFKPVVQQPAGLKRGKLMGYQLEGLNWLLSNYHDGRSVVLADEMGLGKTIQVISLVTSLTQDAPKCWPFLIVVPNSTCPNWRREFKQWAPDLRVVTYHGGKESQELAYSYELFPNGSLDMRAHVVIMSYDSAQDPKTKVLFKSVRWAGLVVDEGQRLKNDQNLLYVALRSMRIPFRLLLTGTPLQNNKRELFNLLQFIDEKQNAAALDREYEILDKENLPKLHDKIRPYFLRRTKLGVLKFLPPMAQIILPVTMTVIQERLAKSIMAKNPQLIKAMFSNDSMSRKDKSSLNNILMQLRKVLCHPFMYSEAIEERHHDPSVLHQNLVEASAKLLLLEVMLPKLKEQGHRVLIFSQFLQQLDILEDFLTGVGYQFRRLDGTMSSLEKQRRIDAFNAPDSELFAFLLSTRSGGVGINLATADTVIIMDPDFNPHQDIQALSRAHRIGQKKKVLCFQLMTKDTVEERIMQIGRKKMALDHALIESMDDEQLAGDDLESILKHGAQALFSDDFQKTTIHYDENAVEELLDRAKSEQTKTDDEGSAETQYSHARVWAGESSGFAEGLDTAEDQAPEPISSSVWDKILAQREEEARREAEKNKEVLGRGGRRRQKIDYKTNASAEAMDAALPEGIDPESSDSSDDFAGANSSEESEEEEGPIKEDEAKNLQAPATVSVGQERGISRKSRSIAAEAATSAEKKPGEKAGSGAGRPARNASEKPKPLSAAAYDAYQNAWRLHSVKDRYRNSPGGGAEGVFSNGGEVPAFPGPPAAPSNGYAFQHGIPGAFQAGHPGYHGSGGERGHQSQPVQAMNAPPRRTPGDGHSSRMHGQRTGLQASPRPRQAHSEAAVRLAIDNVRHSSASDKTKQQMISLLYEQLRVDRSQFGPQHSQTGHSRSQTHSHARTQHQHQQHQQQHQQAHHQAQSQNHYQYHYPPRPYQS
ncbi:hypothetical protein HIM_01031 [Hirsutella minnesotensis 3608]|nr:hypothetical protein HIM_01031 [Hirsutella minnesotensis 3608]